MLLLCYFSFHVFLLWLQYKRKKKRRTSNNVHVVFFSTTGATQVTTPTAPPLATTPVGAKEAAMTPSSCDNLFLIAVVSSSVPSPKIFTWACACVLQHKRRNCQNFCLTLAIIFCCYANLLLRRTDATSTNLTWPCVMVFLDPTVTSKSKAQA